MRKLFALIVLSAAVACGNLNDDGTTAPSNDVDVAGTYTLKTINGSPLPYRTQDEADIQVDMVSGTYTLTSSGTFTESLNFSITSTGQSPETETVSASGTYTTGSGKVHFTVTSEDSPHTFDMTIGANNTLTMSENGMDWVYQK